MRHHFRSSSLRLRRLVHQRLEIALPFFMALLLLINQCKANKSDIDFESKQLSFPSAEYNLRGYSNSEQWTYKSPTNRIINGKQHNLDLVEGNEIQRRSVEENIPTIFLTPSSTFQIIMSILLGILIILQLFVFMKFLRNRSKRVLEFTQPDAICIFVACSIVATASCYLYIYLSSSFTCAIREPLLFMSVSLMGATVAGRAWRISTLVNNPLLTAGGGSDSNVSKIEQIRQYMLGMLSVLAAVGCSISSLHKMRSTNMSVRREDRRRRRSSTIRMRVTLAQMMRATFFMILPQLLWQVVVLSTPALRSSRELASNDYLYNDGHQMMTMEQYKCQSSVGLLPHCISMFLALCPYAIAYILNIRPKSELDLLPEMIDEKEKLEQSFYIFARVITVSAPVIGLTYANSPEARVYSTICAVLALPLACCYNIAYLKLNAIKSDEPKQQARRSSIGHSRMSRTSRLSRGKGELERHSATSVFRMAEMYSRIGRNEEAVQLVDETLELYRKSNTGDRPNVGVRSGVNQEVSLGFTKSDLRSLEEEELELIIQLLKLKFNALERLEGMSGILKRANMIVGIIKIFENCPAAKKMKETSFMFPIYNLAGELIKTVVIDGNDDFSLEMELATHFCREVQLQSYHYVRSLANLAELYARVGMPGEAFKYFDIMEAMYMKQEHPKLLTNTYAVDRCAVCYASSALWYLQLGEISNAIERCNYVIDHILPQYDKSDIFGLYNVFIPLIRVLKWNGEAEKALEAYSTFMPDAANTHWATANIHKPTILLLQICEGSSHQYNESLISQDIETVLSFDVTNAQDFYAINYGWSMNTLAAELCMLLAQRLGADDTSRERLIERGIMMARIAQQHSTTSNGKMKHILALASNIDVYKTLLQLANRDSDVVVVEDFPHQIDANRASFSQSETSGKLGLNGSVSMISNSALSLSNKLETGVSASMLEGATAGSEGASTPLAHVSVPPKRKVSWKGSFGPSKLSSLQSCASIDEDPENHEAE